MQIMTSYADLLRKIKILESQLEIIETELEYWFGKGDIMFGSRGSAKFGLMAAMGNIENLHQRKHDISKMLEFYKEVEVEIREDIESLEGLPYKIAKLRFIDGFSYQEIADKLGLTYGYIRQIVSKSNKERTAILKKA